MKRQLGERLPPRARTIALWFAACALVAPAASATYPEFGPNDVPTVFFISKSDDHNRVDYWMRLDKNCQPTSDEAVTPYWREFEKAPPVVTHSINTLDRMAYGISAQRIVSRDATSADYALRLKAVDRPIGITTRKGADGKCVAVGRTVINGVVSQFSYVFVKLAGPLSVEYIDINGRDFRTSKPVVERLKK
jgi:hypothetical protein